MGGGLDKLTNRLLSAAGAVVLAAALSHTPARAADLGGDCCADLEERVAELEATTVRKGNKKVSITLYGQVNKAVLFWNDGAEKNVYTVDNNYESSRYGLKGSAKISGDWSAGYRLELEPTQANSARLNQFDDDNATDPIGAFNTRHNFLYLNNKKWGEVRMGLTATPIYNITKDTNVSELEDDMHSDNRVMQSFFLRSTGFDNSEGLSGALGGQKVRWSDISRCYSSSNSFVCSTRRNGVAYWSPNWQGFSASWGWFEDDDWGAALRYKKEWGEAFEVGAGIGYENFRDERLQNGGGGSASGDSPPGKDTFFKRNFDEWAGSASIKHKPTGLFAFTAFSFSDSSDSNAIGIYTKNGPPQMSAWDVQIGIQRKVPWFGLDTLGDTSFWGGFLNINNGIAQGSNGDGGNLGRVPANGYLAVGTFADVGVPVQITGADVNRWYLGFDQALDKANMHLYAGYQHLEADVDLVDVDLKHVPASLDNFDLFYMGARLYF